MHQHFHPGPLTFTSTVKIFVEDDLSRVWSPKFGRTKRFYDRLYSANVSPNNGTVSLSSSFFSSDVGNFVRFGFGGFHSSFVSKLENDILQLQ